MTRDAARLKSLLKDHALSIGFDAFGVTTPAPDALRRKRLDAFLAQGRHGDMLWMTDRREQRAAPSALWPDVKSVISLGMNYGPHHDPLDSLQQVDRGVISVYAQNRDYHDVVKKRLKQLARFIIEQAPCDVKVFVDTAPVMEKPLAEAAGLGWQGKHTNLVSRDFGSWLFLGEIYTTLELPPDEKETDHCGSCRSCLDICPTDAFPAPRELDARRCISYLTIEHKGPIAREFRVAMGNRIYGCDDCLAVCPWNKFAERSREIKFLARDDLQAPGLSELLELDDTAFREKFSGSPIKRTGRDRFIRNVLIAAGNSGDQSLTEKIVPLLDDPAPVVRGAAVWALRRLNPDKAAALRASALEKEHDLNVAEEWTCDGV